MHDVPNLMNNNQITLLGHKSIREWVYGSTVGQWIYEGGHTVE